MAGGPGSPTTADSKPKSAPSIVNPNGLGFRVYRVEGSKPETSILNFKALIVILLTLNLDTESPVQPGPRPPTLKRTLNPVKPLTLP